MWRSGKKKFASLLQAGSKQPAPQEAPAAAAPEERRARAAWDLESAPARPPDTAGPEVASAAHGPTPVHHKDPEAALALLGPDRPERPPAPEFYSSWQSAATEGARESKLPPLSTFPIGYFRATRKEVISSTNTSASQTSDDERPETPDVSQLRGPKSSALTASPLEEQTQMPTNKLMPSAAAKHASRPPPLLLSAVQSPPTPNAPEEIPTPMFETGKPPTPGESEGEVETDDEDGSEDQECLPQNDEESERPDDDSSSSRSEGHMEVVANPHEIEGEVETDDEDGREDQEISLQNDEESEREMRPGVPSAVERKDFSSSLSDDHWQVEHEIEFSSDHQHAAVASQGVGTTSVEEQSSSLDQEAPIAALDSEATSAAEMPADMFQMTCSTLQPQKCAIGPEQEIAGNSAENALNENSAHNAPVLSLGSNHDSMQFECLDESQHNALRPKEETHTQRAAEEEVLLLRIRVADLQQSLAHADKMNAKLEHELVRVRGALADRARRQKQSHQEALALRHELDGLLAAAAHLCHLDAVSLEFDSRREQRTRNRRVEPPNSARVQHLLILCRLQAQQLTEMSDLIAREMPRSWQGEVAKGIAKGSAVIHPLLPSVHVDSQCSSDEACANDASVTASTTARAATDKQDGRAGATTHRQHVERLAECLSTFSLSERDSSQAGDETHLLLDALKAQWTAHAGLRISPSALNTH